MEDFTHWFPSSGLVARYKPRILKEVADYCRRYFLPPEDVLNEALRLAFIAEQRFDASRGLDFSTLLRWYLKGLHRYCKREYRGRRGSSGKLDWVSAEGGQQLTRSRGNTDAGDCGGDGVRRAPNTSFHFYETPDGDRRRLVRWSLHRPALIQLEQYQGESLRLIEKAVLDWMIGPDGRKLSHVAAWIGCSKGQASKVRYKLAGKK
jgi:hypothetical protein